MRTFNNPALAGEGARTGSVDKNNRTRFFDFLSRTTCCTYCLYMVRAFPFRSGVHFGHFLSAYDSSNESGRCKRCTCTLHAHARCAPTLQVLLTRVGEFYETYGVDAVMMMQHAGLNKMGQEVRAGCPRKNVQQTLDGLTGAGLTVAVYEEASLSTLWLSVVFFCVLSIAAVARVVAWQQLTNTIVLSKRNADFTTRCTAATPHR